MKLLNLFVLVVSAVFLFSGCSHTNELAKYKIAGEKIIFKHSVKSTSSKVKVIIDDPLENSNKFPFSIILTDAGSDVVRSKVQEKLNNAFDPDAIAKSISAGMRDGLLTYYTINPVESLSDDPRFVIETRLERFELSSASTGVYARTSAEVLIIDRRTGATVWRNSEQSSLPFQEGSRMLTAGLTVRTIGSVVNAVRLMEMTEEEIREAIRFTSSEAGEKLIDQLREDIAESRYKR